MIGGATNAVPYESAALELDTAMQEKHKSFSWNINNMISGMPHSGDAILTATNHYDVIKWKHFLCYWPYVRGTQRPVTWSFDVFFDLHLNTRLSKQSRGWWFDTPSRSLWRHCNE